MWGQATLLKLNQVSSCWGPLSLGERVLFRLCCYWYCCYPQIPRYQLHYNCRKRKANITIHNNQSWHYSFLEYCAFLPDLIRDSDGDGGHFPGNIIASLLVLRHYTDPGPLPRIRLWRFHNRHCYTTENMRQSRNNIWLWCAAKWLLVNWSQDKIEPESVTWPDWCDVLVL